MTSPAAALTEAATLGAIGLGMLVFAVGGPSNGPVPPGAPGQVLRALSACQDSGDANGRSREPSRTREANLTGESQPPPWAAFRPTRLTLGAPGVIGSADVEPVAVVDGRLSLPENADQVGWWRDGARVGSPFGTVVVAGHLDSVTDSAGYLAGLAGLAEGDQVELANAATRQRYRVICNYLLPRADLSARSELFEQDARHRLLLITCGGPFDHRAGEYALNRIVVAVPTA